MSMSDTPVMVKHSRFCQGKSARVSGAFEFLLSRTLEHLVWDEQIDHRVSGRWDVASFEELKEFAARFGVVCWFEGSTFYVQGPQARFA